MEKLTANVTREEFPVPTKQWAEEVGGEDTNFSVMHFSDKIMLTISQGGKLAHWVQVPLSQPSKKIQRDHFSEEDDDPSTSLLPMPHLTAISLLGGTIPEREITGQLLAAQIGTLLVTKRPQEGRVLVVGLGLKKEDLPRSEFRELVGLALKGLI